MTLLDDLGIEQCQVSFGKEATFAGGDVQVSLQVEAGALGITGPLSLRWIASGDMLSSFIDEAVAGAGEQGLISLPTTGQPGFARGTQLFSGWFYRATVQRKRNGKTLAPRVYRFQIPAGTLSMDLDALDENGQVTALPATAPMPTVTSFLGLTGAITEDDLPGLPPSGGAGGVLSGSYPNPGINDTTLDTIIAGKLGVSSTATAAAANTLVAAKIATLIGNAPTALDTLAEIAAQISSDESATAALVATIGTKLTQGQVDARVALQIQQLVGSAPAALDTLAEIDAQLAADEGAAAALAALVATKADAAAVAATYSPWIEAFEGCTYTAIGHSYVAGANQAVGSRWVDRVQNRLRTLAQTNLGNYGYSSAQIAQVALSSWAPGTRGLVALMGVFNDVQYFTTDPNGPKTTREAFRTILAMLTAGAAYGPLSAALSFSGSWIAGPTTGVYGGASRKTTTVGDYVDVAWNGDTCYLLVQGTYDGSGGTLTVTRSGDAAQVAQVNFDGYASGLNGHGGTVPLAIKLSGFGAGAHTVRAKLTAGSSVVINAVLIPSPTPPTIVLVREGPVVTYLAGYSGTTNGGTASGNAALVGTYQPVLDGLLADFPTVVITPSGGPAGWDAATMCGLDGLHPNDKGSACFASGAIAALRSKTWRDGQNWLGAPFADTAPTAAYTSPGATAPSTPAAPGATTDNQVAFTWTAPADGGATISSYLLQALISSTWTTIGTAGGTARALTVTTGLTQGTSYSTRIIAVNSVGQSTPSATTTVTAGAVPQTYAADTFTRADSTTAPGSTETGGYAWTVAGASNKFGISSNRLYPTTLSTFPPILTIDDGQSTGTWQVTLAGPLSAGQGLEICVAADNSTAYRFQRLNTGQYILYKRTSSTALSVLATAPGTPGVQGDVITLIRNSAGLMTGKVNGTTMVTATDTTYNTTKSGVFTDSNAALFDDYSHKSNVT